MSDTTADDKADKKPKPIFNPDDVVEPAVDFGPADPTPADVAVEEPAVEEPAVEETAPAAKAPVAKTSAEKKPARKPKADADAAPAPADAAATGSVAPASTDATPADSAYAGREVVYVQAPVPPKLRGNRGVGVLLAILGPAVFAAAFAGIAFLLIATTLSNQGATFAQFITTSVFLVPVSIFLIAFILLVLIVNRAGWAAHVFGSLLVGLVVYFGTAGVAVLLYAVGGGAGQPTYADMLANPFVIIAALLAREVSIWIGLAIAARGRRVKARNLELVDEWEQEHAETKAQYERAGSTA